MFKVSIYLKQSLKKKKKKTFVIKMHFSDLPAEGVVSYSLD